MEPGIALAIIRSVILVGILFVLVAIHGKLERIATDTTQINLMIKAQRAGR